MHLKLQTTIIILLFAYQAAAQSISVAQDKDGEVIQLTREFLADYGSLSRFYEIDYSPEKRERFRNFYDDYLSKLSGVSFEQLSTGGRADYLLFKNYLSNQLYTLSVRDNAYKSLYKWVMYGEALYELEKQRRRGKHLDGKIVAGRLNDISNNIKQSSASIQQEKPLFTRELTSAAERIMLGQKKALKSVFDFYDGYDPQFSWWVTQPYQSLDSLLSSYVGLLNSCVDPLTLPKDDGSGIIGNPIGRKELLRQLQNQMISYTPDQLIEIALKEFAWCETELLRASNEMGFGDNWREAQEKVKQSYVEVGHQPEEMYELYEESVAFLKSHDLLTIPTLAEETWRMQMLSPKRQLIAPFFLGGEILQIAYPTDDMDHEAKLMSLRGNNPHFARAVVHHELIAGHHLQGFMNNRYNTHRFYNTPFWTEGWALYWELILWDEGFAQSPEDRIGMLFWRMHRCARIIFSLNYHLGQWTPQQCIDYLVDRVGHERSTAEGEVRRSFTGGYGPLYQIAYMVGALQFYELKRELVDAEKMSYKEYHDAVLHENNIPVEMLRAILLDQPLEENFKGGWKFYNK